MKRIVLVGMLATACAPVAPLPGPPRAKCTIAPLGNLMGRVAMPMLVTRAQHRAGATIARVLRPGQVVTMEYREGRLNVNVDAGNRIKSFTCG